MPACFAQVILLPKSGASEDVQVNGFATQVTGLDLSLTDANTWVTNLKGFYDDVRALGGCRGLEQNNHLVKIYDIAGAAPNYPLFELNFNLASAVPGIGLPMEVALAVSYSNVSETGVARARRRGRIYLSGWGDASNDDGRPTTTVYEGLATAYDDYVDAQNAVADFQAGVWSRVNGIVYGIETVWCDNEWDTQRRRGGRPTDRYTLTIP